MLLLFSKSRFRKRQKLGADLVLIFLHKPLQVKPRAPKRSLGCFLFDPVNVGHLKGLIMKKLAVTIIVLLFSTSLQAQIAMCFATRKAINLIKH